MHASSPRESHAIGSKDFIKQKLWTQLLLHLYSVQPECFTHIPQLNLPPNPKFWHYWPEKDKAAWRAVYPQQQSYRHVKF